MLPEGQGSVKLDPLEKRCQFVGEFGFSQEQAGVLLRLVLVQSEDGGDAHRDKTALRVAKINFCRVLG